MTLFQMQYFQEVCRLGSTLKASQALNVSQSAISTSIKLLESELKVPLFERTSRGMVPNSAGTFFLRRCEKILSEITRLTADMEQFSEIKRPIRLGIPVVLNSLYWPDLCMELEKKFPDLEFQVTSRTVPVLLEMLKENTVDAVLALRPMPDPQFCRLKLSSCRYRYVTMSQDHPLAKQTMVSYADLLSSPVLGYAGDDYNTQLLKERYRQFGKDLQYKHHCDQFSTLIQLLRRNAGIAYLNKKVSSIYTDLVSLPLKEEQGEHVTYMIWSKNGLPNWLPRTFFQAFRDFFDRVED